MGNLQDWTKTLWERYTKRRCIAACTRDRFTIHKGKKTRSDNATTGEEAQKPLQGRYSRSASSVADRKGERMPKAELSPESLQRFATWITNEETEPRHTVAPSRLVQIGNEDSQYVALLPTALLFDKLLNAVLTYNDLKAVEVELFDLDKDSDDLGRRAQSLDRQMSDIMRCQNDNDVLKLSEVREQLQFVRQRQGHCDRQRNLTEVMHEAQWVEQKGYTDSILTDFGEVFVASKVLQPRKFGTGSSMSNPNSDVQAAPVPNSTDTPLRLADTNEAQTLKNNNSSARVLLLAYERDLEHREWLYERQAEQRKIKRAAGEHVETQLEFDLRLLEMTRRHTRNFIKAEAAYEEAKAAALAGGVQLSDVESGFLSNPEDGAMSSSDDYTKTLDDPGVVSAWIAALPAAALSLLEPCEAPEQHDWSAKSTHVFFLASLLVVTAAVCYDPSPGFPVPDWSDGSHALKPAFKTIEKKLHDIIAAREYDAASFSVDLTSGTASLWSHHHTAREHNETRPGVKHVDGDSLYRIASITKTFTVLGLLYQHEAGNLSLDKPINEYIPQLGGEIPWKDITLRILASQLSGIPRDWAQGDMIKTISDPTQIGLPPASKDGLPTCDEYDKYTPCNATDLFDRLKKQKPLFAPNQESTYSNINFELIGLAIERATGKDFKSYVASTIFSPLNMTSSTMNTPPDTHAVLPLGPNYWDVDEGVQNPAGGIYSSSNDMSKFVRYILTHYNAIATGVNWMMPESWAGALASFYGMPFEIFRTDAILKDSRRPVTFVTKSGGLPGYVSRMTLMPEYGLGLTVLVGCDSGCSNLLEAIQGTITAEIVQAAEDVIWRSIDKKYTGTYAAVNPKLNSSLGLASSPSTGLVLTSFISNGTDILNDIVPNKWQGWVDPSRSWRLQLVPTLLFQNETTQQGEIWRITSAYERHETETRGVWDEFCITDLDVGMYAGLPINEVVFWHDESVVELPAWKVKMKAFTANGEDLDLVVQD